MLWWVALGGAFAGTPDVGERLDQDELIALVEHHPALRAATSAEASARAAAVTRGMRPQPMVEGMVAPATLVDDKHPPGVTVTLSQGLAPWGTVTRARAVGEHGADALGADRDALRDQLVLEAVRAFDQRWLVGRALEVLDRQDALVAELQGRAQARYASGDGLASDPLTVELEAVRLDDERLRWVQEGAVAEVRIRELAAAPDWAVPPLEGPDREGTEAGDRPEGVAAQARTEAAEAGVALARSQGAPKGVVMGQYSSMWSMPAHRWMVGAGVELPLGFKVRRARVEAATAALDQARAAAEEVDLALDAEVGRARVRFEEATARVELVAGRRLPLAEESLAAAREGYEAGLVDVDALLKAARALADAELALASAQAHLDLRGAELAYAEGRL